MKEEITRDEWRLIVWALGKLEDPITGIDVDPDRLRRKIMPRTEWQPTSGESTKEE